MGSRVRRLAVTLFAVGFAMLVLGSLIALGQRTHGAAGVYASQQPGITISASTVPVSITVSGFDPDVVTVTMGTTVAWTNQLAEMVHLVTGEPYQIYLPLVLRNTGSSGADASALPASATISPQDIWGNIDVAPGETYTHTFATPGVYSYYLSTRPRSMGWVIVTDDTTPPVVQIANLNYPDFSVPHYGAATTGTVPSTFTLQFDDASFDDTSGISAALFLVQGYVPVTGSQGSHITFPVGFVGPRPFTYTVTNGAGLQGAMTGTVTGTNTAPTAPAVSMSPAYPTTGDDLVCTVTTPSTDTNGDPITYTYGWQIGAVPQPALTTVTTVLSVTIDAFNTAKSDTWRCVVTPTDGMDDSSSAWDQVTIVNSPPSQPGVSVTPALPYTTDSLVCTVTTPSTDADGDSIAYSYQWYVNESPVATGSTLGPTYMSRGDTCRCEVTPYDGTDYGSSASDQVTVINSPPTAPGVDVTPDLPVTSDDLTCAIATPSTDADGDTITYAYLWYENGIPDFDETSSTLGSVKTDAGEGWRCEVTPYDGYINGPAGYDEVTIQ